MAGKLRQFDVTSSAPAASFTSEKLVGMMRISSGRQSELHFYRGLLVFAVDLLLLRPLAEVFDSKDYFLVFLHFNLFESFIFLSFPLHVQGGVKF